MNSPGEYIKQWCNQTLMDRYQLELGEGALVTLLATIVSIFLVGGCIGSLFAATLADKFGRFVWQIMLTHVKSTGKWQEGHSDELIRFSAFLSANTQAIRKFARFPITILGWILSLRQCPLFCCFYRKYKSKLLWKCGANELICSFFSFRVI